MNEPQASPVQNGAITSTEPPDVPDLPLEAAPAAVDPAAEYERLLRKLLTMEKAGQIDGDEAEAIREEMDPFWNLLTEAEQEHMDQLGAELLAELEPPPPPAPAPKVKKVRAKKAPKKAKVSKLLLPEDLARIEKRIRDQGQQMIHARDIALCLEDYPKRKAQIATKAALKVLVKDGVVEELVRGFYRIASSEE